MKFAISLSVAIGIIAACYPDNIRSPEPVWEMTGGNHDAGRE